MTQTTPTSQNLLSLREEGITASCAINSWLEWKHEDHHVRLGKILDCTACNYRHKLCPLMMRIVRALWPNEAEAIQASLENTRFQLLEVPPIPCGECGGRTAYPTKSTDWQFCNQELKIFHRCCHKSCLDCHPAPLIMSPDDHLVWLRKSKQALEADKAFIQSQIREKTKLKAEQWSQFQELALNTQSEDQDHMTIKMHNMLELRSVTIGHITKLKRDYKGAHEAWSQKKPDLRHVKRRRIEDAQLEKAKRANFQTCTICYDQSAKYSHVRNQDKSQGCRRNLCANCKQRVQTCPFCRGKLDSGSFQVEIYVQ